MKRMFVRPLHRRKGLGAASEIPQEYRKHWVFMKLKLE